MTYRCRCEDGPAKGTEFHDFGPPVKVGLPHDGKIIEYRLSNIVDDLCLYQYSEAPEERPS